jgi:DNA-binding transcriptional MerR regulator
MAKTREPTPYTIHDLVARTGVATRTIRRYIAQRVLPKANGYGRAARYGETHLKRLLVAKKLRSDGLDNFNIPRWVREMTPEEIDLELAPPEGAARSPTAVEEESTRPRDASSHSRWLRIALVPGLELFVREGSGAVVDRLAAEIEERYALRS